MTETERVETILKWREALSKLPDNHFFELMRVYLGEIKTPYNKQNLIERLSTFLRLPQVRENIVLLLDEHDVLFLAAAREISVPTFDTLTLFFKDTYTPRQVRETLFNLEERLLLYRFYNTEGKGVFALNPHLYDVVEKFTDARVLFPTEKQPSIPEKTGFVQETDFCLSPLFLAAWFSFISAETDICKIDGTFKKRTESVIESVFPHLAHKNGIQLAVSLTEALKNLHLLRQNNATLQPHFERWLDFSEIDDWSQAMYLVAAACGRFTRGALNQLAQFASDLWTTIPHGCTKQILYRSAFLLQEKQSVLPQKSRVSALIQRRKSGENAPNFSSELSAEASIQTIIEKMQLFGLLREHNGLFTAIRRTESALSAGTLRIDAGFTVTILPEISLAKLLPIVRFLNITRFDTAAIFEISKASCLRAFGAGVSPQEITQILKEQTHAVSQNLAFSIQDWFLAYSSVRLYKGYILHVSDEKRHLIEGKGHFENHVIKKIADGVYLLDFASDEEAADIFKKTGLPFAGVVEALRSRQESFPLLPVRENLQSADTTKDSHNSVSSTNDFSQRFAIERALTDEIAKNNFSAEEENCFLSRVARRIILIPEQLRAESVRFEKVEATGMDFLGKLHVIEHASANDCIVEITYEETQNGKKVEKIHRGIPISLQKQDGGALVTLKIEDGSKTEILPVEKALRVKRIRGSIFKDSV